MAIFNSYVSSSHATDFQMLVYQRVHQDRSRKTIRTKKTQDLSLQVFPQLLCHMKQVNHMGSVGSILQ